MWVRGLKLRKRYAVENRIESHPMWVRGLKQRLSLLLILTVLVASYVGAWIETAKTDNKIKNQTVASYVGAWIETQRKANQMNYKIVASYVGAWIET